jgi:hypothetical protein
MGWKDELWVNRTDRGLAGRRVSRAYVDKAVGQVVGKAVGLTRRLGGRVVERSGGATFSG